MIPEPLGGLKIDAAEGIEFVLGQKPVHFRFGLGSEIGVLVELGLEALDLAKAPNERGAGVVAFQSGHGLGFRLKPLRLHELVELAEGGLQFLNDFGRGIHEPDFTGLGLVLDAGEKGDGGVHGGLLLAKIKNLAVRFGGVEDAVGARESLNEAVVLQVLIHVEGVEIFRVEAGEEHVHDDGDINLLGTLAGQVGVGELLVLDALLDVLIVTVKPIEFSE